MSKIEDTITLLQFIVDFFKSLFDRFQRTNFGMCLEFALGDKIEFH